MLGFIKHIILQMVAKLIYKRHWKGQGRAYLVFRKVWRVVFNTGETVVRTSYYWNLIYEI